MQTRHNKQVHSVNICQRLFNFFVHNFVSRGLKRLTSGSPHSSTHIPVDVHNENVVQPNHSIHVHFKDGEDDDHLRSWTRLDHGVGSSLHIGETKDEIDSGQVRHKGGKMVSISDGKEERGEEKKGKKKKKKKLLSNTSNLLGEKLPLVIDPRDEEELDSLIVRPHLISVASNINEKSDEFIKTRIAAMQDKH